MAWCAVVRPGLCYKNQDGRRVQVIRDDARPHDHLNTHDTPSPYVSSTNATRPTGQRRLAVFLPLNILARAVTDLFPTRQKWQTTAGQAFLRRTKRGMRMASSWRPGQTPCRDDTVAGRRGIRIGQRDRQISNTASRRARLVGHPAYNLV
jgi:hypothetical protein